MGGCRLQLVVLLVDGEEGVHHITPLTRIAGPARMSMRRSRSALYLLCVRFTVLMKVSAMLSQMKVRMKSFSSWAASGSLPGRGRGGREEEEEQAQAARRRCAGGEEEVRRLPKPRASEGGVLQARARAEGGRSPRPGARQAPGGRPSGQSQDILAGGRKFLRGPRRPHRKLWRGEGQATSPKTVAGGGAGDLTENTRRGGAPVSGEIDIYILYDGIKCI